LFSALLVEVDVKSRAGRRSFAVPDELYALLLKHDELQQREREHAGSEPKISTLA
jgi:hypothetical protein